MSNRGRGQHRKNCLLAFIQECLSDSSMSHLIRWTNKTQEIFQVLWVHAGRSNYYRKTQGCLFDLYREYRGRGMTSDPKQAFRMALKKSPCIRAVIVPNVQEDWRTFQIIQKCHQNLSNESECATSDSKRASMKIKSPPKTIEMDMPNFKIVFPSSFTDEDDKIPTGHCKISLSDLTSCKSSENIKMNYNDDNSQISVIINSPHDLHNFIIQRAFQNKNKKECKFMNDSERIDPVNINNNHQKGVREEETNENIVCCGNPCCRYTVSAKAYDFTNRFPVRNDLAPSYIPHRNSSNLSSQLTNEPYSCAATSSFENLPFDVGPYTPPLNQSTFGALHSNTDVSNWDSNYKFHRSTQSSEIKENSSQVFDLASFQPSYEIQSNSHPSEDVRGFQNYETDNASPIFRPEEEVLQKNLCAEGADFDFGNADQNFDIFLPRDETYDKSCSAYSQWNSYETQQMVPCNWA